MVEKICRTCPFSAMCVGGGGLEELISRLVVEYMERFVEAGDPPKSDYERGAVKEVAATQASQRVKDLLEDKMPEECPILRRHNANSEGKTVVWVDAYEDGEDPVS